MGVVNRRWVWVESMGVKYRFPHITYPYSCTCSFWQQHPNFFLLFLCFSFFWSVFPWFHVFPTSDLSGSVLYS